MCKSTVKTPEGEHAAALPIAVQCVPMCTSRHHASYVAAHTALSLRQITRVSSKLAHTPHAVLNIFSTKIATTPKSSRGKERLGTASTIAVQATGELVHKHVRRGHKIPRLRPLTATHRCPPPARPCNFTYAACMCVIFEAVKD